MTQTERVVDYIRRHPGCSTLDLLRGMDPPITNPRARISDARARGINIVCKPRSVEAGAVDGYWIVEAFDGTLGLGRDAA